MNLPLTLHGQLYLLAYDQNRHRFDVDSLHFLGHALRAAMLTDLFLEGCLADQNGTVRPLHHTRQSDPLLRILFQEVDREQEHNWSWFISARAAHTPRLVHDQLESQGWVCPQRWRKLGIFSTVRPGLRDELAVGSRADGIRRTLHQAMAGQAGEVHSLTLGLLGILAELPTVLSADEYTANRPALNTLMLDAMAPLVGLRDAVESSYALAQNKDAGILVGCSGGCGGCGGCGG